MQIRHEARAEAAKNAHERHGAAVHERCREQDAERVTENLEHTFIGDGPEQSG